MLSKRLFAVVLVAAICLSSATRLNAVTDVSLKWHTLTTEHFRVHFHTGAEWTAQRVAQIAEEVFPHITGLYDYDPGIVDFIIKDTEDYANGAAYFYDNKVEIWATNLDFGMRGTTQWLRNVITHEYTHIVSIQAAMKMSRRVPALYFQMISFEDEKRPDVLTGYPDGIVSYPFVGAVIPMWWAEGVAQYMAPGKQTDCWDTHRDMILRAGLEEDKMLTYDNMGYFGHGSAGNEMVYDHGFGLVRYIAHTYGPDSIRKISEQMGKLYRMSIDGALKKVTGRDGNELYKDWRQSLAQRYDIMLDEVRTNGREGVVFDIKGNLTTAPSFSPDGNKVTFLSNKGSEYARTSLYVADSDGRNVKQLKGSVSSRPVFSPDGRRILYARHRRTNAYNAMVSDLHVYELETKKETRLTKKQRASQPGYSPDGKKIVCILNSDGTQRLATMNADGSAMRLLFERENGTQFYGPQYSPGGDRILFGVFEKGTRQIATIDTTGGDFQWVVRTQNDERNARWLPDGSGIVFASDRTGIFNIYTTTTDSGTYNQLTNVIGGAFWPDISPADGSLVYSLYNGDGYHVATLGGHKSAVAQLDELAYAQRTLGDLDDCADLKGGGETFPALFGADATAATIVPVGERTSGIESGGAGETVAVTPGAGTAIEPEDYKLTYSNLQFFPRFVLWDGTPRFGAFVAGSEILEKQFFFFGGSYGIDGRFDAFINFELRFIFPVIFLEFFRMREKTSEYTQLEDDPDFDAINLEEIRYDLWAADLGVRLEFVDPFSLTVRNDFALWYSHSEYRIHIDWFGEKDGQKLLQDPVAWRYFIGDDLKARWRYKSISLATDANINPRGGREFKLEYTYAHDRLFNGGEFEYALRPEFTEYNFNQVSVDWREYFPLPWFRHSLQIRALGSYIDRRVDDFFWVYLGGMDGIRGYTYYSIGGQRAALASGTYRFPILRNIGKQLSWISLRDIYGGVFFEGAKSWRNHNEAMGVSNDIYTSVGGELRVQMNSFYAYPTAISLTAARSLDRSAFFLPAFDLLTFHEPQWRYYLTVGFIF
jgi:Tol biopolymer transport system component